MKKFYFSSLALDQNRQKETLQEAVDEAIQLTQSGGKDHYIWELKRVVKLAKPPVIVEKVK